jgi:hypothetical protein
VGSGTVRGQGSFGQCSRCSRSVGKLDRAISDHEGIALCALCRSDRDHGRWEAA